MIEDESYSFEEYSVESIVEESLAASSIEESIEQSGQIKEIKEEESYDDDFEESEETKYEEDFDSVRSDEYSLDFENNIESSKSSLKSLKEQNETLPVIQEEKAESVERILAKLTSEKRLPVQIAEIRASVRNEDNVHEALDQLAIDLLATERKRRMNQRQRLASRQRADARRRHHELRLAEAEKRARERDVKLTVVEEENKELRLTLQAKDQLLYAAAETEKALREDSRALHTKCINFAERSARLAAESAAAAALADDEREKLKDALRKAELRAELTASALEAMESRQQQVIDRLPEIEARRIAAEDARLDEKQKIVYAEIQAQRDREDAWERRLQTQETTMKEDRERQLRLWQIEEAARREALERLSAHENARLEKERAELDAASAALDSKREALARDVSKHNAQMSALREQRASLAAKQTALEPRFAEAEAAERRAKARLIEAEEAHNEAIQAQKNADRREIELDEAIASAQSAQERAEAAHKRATDFAKHCHSMTLQSDSVTMPSYTALPPCAAGKENIESGYSTPSSTRGAKIEPYFFPDASSPTTKPLITKNEKIGPPLVYDWPLVPPPPVPSPKNASEKQLHSDDNSSTPEYPALPSANLRITPHRNHEDFLAGHFFARIRSNSEPYDPIAFSQAASNLANASILASRRRQLARRKLEFEARQAGVYEPAKPSPLSPASTTLSSFEQ